MKKYIIFLILQSFFFIGYSWNAISMTGEYQICPDQNHQMINPYTGILGAVNSYDRIEWDITNGYFDYYLGPTKRTVYVKDGAIALQADIVWEDIAKMGKVSFKNLSNPYVCYGFADVEILSVKNTAVDEIKIDGTVIKSGTITIPKGEKGTLQVATYLIYPACKGNSGKRVEEFRWSTPASWGGKTFETYGGQISINYNETSGDGEKITVTPKGCNGTYGKATSITIKRTGEYPKPEPEPEPEPSGPRVIQNVEIPDKKGGKFSGDSLILKEVYAYPGGGTTFHGNYWIRILPTLYAFKGSELHFTTGNKTKNLIKANTKEIFTETVQEHISGFSQNYPNPCWGNTKIDYYLPENTRNAVLYVVSSTGETVRNLSLYERDSGTLNLDISGLSPGFYLYYIVADGQMIGSKRMIVTNR